MRGWCARIGGTTGGNALCRWARLAATAGAALLLALAGTAGARAGVVDSGADYLIDTLQDMTPGTGGFFQDAGPGSYYPSTQGQFGLAILRAYQVETDPVKKAKYLASANNLAEAILHPETHAVLDSGGAGEVYFDMAGMSGPIVWTQSTLFLQNLAQTTTNTALANEVHTYLQSNYFAPLAAGTYGAGDSAHAFGGGAGVDSHGYVLDVQAACGEWSAWCLAKPVVAAHQAGQSQLATELFAGIAAGLEMAGSVTAPSDGGYRYDTLGLAAALWASALTGMNLQLGSGEWFDAYCSSLATCTPGVTTLSTQNLAQLLASLMQPDGSLLSDPFTADPNATFADIETTSDAILALAALDPAAYENEIDAGLGYLVGLQDNGCFACDDYPSYIQAEVLQLVTETDAATNGPAGSVQQFYPAPEPASLALFGVGLGALALVRRRRAQVARATS